jgi:hypothetical protein
MSSPVSPLRPRRGVTYLPSLIFLTWGWMAFVLFCALVWWRPEWLLNAPAETPVRPLAALLAVGWIASMIFGAGYHVMPMLSGLPLWSRRLPWVHVGLHTFGSLAVAAAVAGVAPGALVPGVTAVLVGMALFGFNQQLTAGRLSLWEPSTITFTLAVFWLGVTGVLVALIHTGSITAIARAEPAELTALVINLGVGGFLLLALLGVALKLIPMFLVSAVQPGLLAWVGCLLVSGGLHALAVGELAAIEAWRVPAAWLVAAGIGAYLLELLQVALAARRAPGWDLSIAGVGLLLLAPVWWWMLKHLPGGENLLTTVAPAEALRALILLTLLGPLTFAVMGLSIRLVPLIAWQIRFADRVGYEPVPAADSLVWRATLPPLALALLLGWGYLAAGLWWHEKTGLIFAAASYLLAIGLWLIALAPAIWAVVRRRSAAPAAARIALTPTASGYQADPA